MSNIEAPKAKRNLKKKVALALAAPAFLLPAACSPEDAPKAQETVNVQDTPDAWDIDTPEAPQDEFHSSIDVHQVDETHFQGEIVIDPDDSNIGIPVEGDGLVRVDPNLDTEEYLYKSVAFADIVSDSDLSIAIDDFRIGDRVLSSNEYDDIIRVVQDEPNLYRIAIVHPERFKPQGAIKIQIRGETDNFSSVDGGVSFNMVRRKDADQLLP